VVTFEVHPDITQAQTLPGAFYSDPEYFELCREKVFRPSWQLVADAESIRIPGQCHPVTLLPGCLDEPILLTRDKADKLHCMSNVCTHRGTILCEHAGVEKALVCRYHGRRFDLDGTFRHMPEFERTKDFPSPADNLPRVAFGAIGGSFYFASLAPSAPLEQVLGPMMKRVGWLPLREFRFDRSRSRDYLVRANWALYIDNYLEGFHIPFVHASLNEAIDYGEYTTELFEGSSLQLGIAKPGEPAFDVPAGSPDAGKRVAAYYWWLFPNTMFNFYPWGLSINVVEPQGHDRTRVRFLSYVWDEKKLDQGAGAGLDRVEREDEAVVEAVQAGTRSSLYTRGRYSPTREQGVHHFHRMLAGCLFS
jgi:phenylpropionate dioxygenase-like ring-hydroxylating dioxygenase large terminal subunit